MRTVMEVDSLCLGAAVAAEDGPASAAAAAASGGWLRLLETGSCGNSSARGVQAREGGPRGQVNVVVVVSVCVCWHPSPRLHVLQGSPPAKLQALPSAA